MENAGFVNGVSIAFPPNREWNNLGHIIITASRDETLTELSLMEAKEHGEEPIQLFEGCSYEYQLIDVPQELHLRPSNIISNSRAHPDTMGRIETGNYTGLLSFVLEDSDGNPVATAAVEVRSSKLDYRTQYRQMLDDIGEKCGELLLDMRTPMQARLLPNPGEDPETIQQRFAFLRSLLDSRDFQEALQRLISMPHRRLEADPQERDIRRGVRPDSNMLRQIASRNPRLPLPASHPLAARMSGLGVAHPSVPAMVTVRQQRDTVDTPENRFVKHALTVYVDFLTKMEASLLKRQEKTYQRLTREVARLREKLAEVLSRDFFREISEPTVLPLGSPVLQRKAGYREMLQAWLKFNLAAALVWNGGEDVFGAGKRDVAVLYEYWLFFQLFDLVAETCGLSQPPSESLFEGTDRLNLRLKQGKQLSLEGVYAHGRCPLKVRFSYNRTFSYTAGQELAGTWTRQMRPDYTLSIWPHDLEEKVAEQLGKITHLHFDAKYRADHIDDLVGRQDGEEDIGQERSEQRRGIYKRADLLKMHAYRDAIRRTEGAYVLYPGDNSNVWPMYPENKHILPSLGAFAVRPGVKGEAAGMQDVADFLAKVLEHLCERYLCEAEPHSE